MKTRFRMIRGMVGAIAIAAVGFSMSTAFGVDIPLTELPAEVSKAVTERFPKADLIKAEKETDNGQVKFEVKIRENGAFKEAHVTPDGKILKVEDED